MVPTFPKARYWVGAKDWEFFRTEENLEKFPTNRKCVAPLEEMGLMEFMEDEKALTVRHYALIDAGAHAWAHESADLFPRRKGPSAGGCGASPGATA